MFILGRYHTEERIVSELKDRQKSPKLDKEAKRGAVFDKGIDEMDTENSMYKRKRENTRDDRSYRNDVAESSSKLQNKTIVAQIRKLNNNLDDPNVLYSTIDLSNTNRTEIYHKQPKIYADEIGTEDQRKGSARRNQSNYISNYKETEDWTGETLESSSSDDSDQVICVTQKSKTAINIKDLTTSHGLSRKHRYLQDTNRDSMYNETRNIRDASSDNDGPDMIVREYGQASVTGNMDNTTYFDTQEDLKMSDEETTGFSGSRRSSLYFDEQDGKYGKWKRCVIDQ